MCLSPCILIRYVINSCCILHDGAEPSLSKLSSSIGVWILSYFSHFFPGKWGFNESHVLVKCELYILYSDISQARLISSAFHPKRRKPQHTEKPWWGKRKAVAPSPLIPTLPALHHHRLHHHHPTTTTTTTSTTASPPPPRHRHHLISPPPTIPPHNHHPTTATTTPL